MLKNKPRIFVVMGVSGCGKSTIGKLLAKAFEIPFFDGDDFHPEANIKKMSAGTPLNDDDRAGWLTKLNALSIANQATGAVLACSALKAAYRHRIEKQLEGDIQWVYLKGSYLEISERLKQRTAHFMPEHLLKSQFDILEAPENAINIPINNAPTVIIDYILKEYQQIN